LIVLAAQAGRDHQRRGAIVGSKAVVRTGAQQVAQDGQR
jgi:hypothetical protein